MQISPIKNFNFKKMAPINKAPFYCANFNKINSLQKDTVSFTSTKKSNSEPTRAQKIDFIKSKCKLDTRIGNVNEFSDEKIDRIIYLLDQEIDLNHAAEISDLKEKHYKRALELLEKDVDSYYARQIAQFEDKNYTRAIYLTEIAHSSQVKELSLLDDKDFSKAMKLIKKGVSAEIASWLTRESEEIYQKALFLLDKKVRPYDVCTLCKKSDEATQEALDLIKQGANSYDATKCATELGPRWYLNKLISKGYDVPTSVILANLACFEMLDEAQISSLANIVRIIRSNSKEVPEFSAVLNGFINYDNLKDINLKDFEEYVSQIDFKQIKSIAPEVKKYTNKELLTFLDWHFETYTTEFDETSLTFSNDLTSYLEQNWTSPKELNKILLGCPLTKREVGKIPADWLNKVDDKEKATKEIYKAVKKFQNNSNLEEFSSSLSKILNKKAKATYLGKGVYAKAYKLEIEDAQASCIKIFSSKQNTFIIKDHGRNSEVQMGLFLNKHSNEFVKMHFGKVCDEKRRDGFLVTQFLSPDTTPIKNNNPNSDGYRIIYGDNHRKNLINDIIIDYGGTTITRI